MSNFFAKPAGQERNRGFSREMWLNCPREEIRIDRSVGYYFEDDFSDLPTGRYTVTQATNGTFALDDADGGVALADCASSTNGQGVTVQLGGAGGAFLTPAAGKKIWFEARLKIVDAATPPEFFIGLSEIDTTLISTGANSSANHIGFENVAVSGVALTTVSEKAGARNANAGESTFTDDAWTKLGFYVNGVTNITFYQNGVALASKNVAANIPVVGLTPSLVCQSNGTTDPVVHLDWWEVYVEDRDDVTHST